MTDLAAFLDTITIDADVAALRPDYRVMLVGVDNMIPGPSDAASEMILSEAESLALAALSETALEDLPHNAAWREAYRAFGAKPQRTRNSMEALLRRVPDGLPRINRITDIYNAICIKHQLPCGGENIAAYIGAPVLTRATGTEEFETLAGGEESIEHSDAGEVIWRDDAGVTCRRWNWRQCRRTAFTDETTCCFFILDILDPMTDEQAHAAADELISQLASFSPELISTRKLLRAGS